MVSDRALNPRKYDSKWSSWIIFHGLASNCRTIQQQCYFLSQRPPTSNTPICSKVQLPSRTAALPDARPFVLVYENPTCSTGPQILDVLSCTVGFLMATHWPRTLPPLKATPRPHQVKRLTSVWLKLEWRDTWACDIASGVECSSDCNLTDRVLSEISGVPVQPEVIPRD